MPRVAIVAAASNGSQSGIRRQSNRSSEASQRYQRQQMSHKGNRGFDEVGRRSYNRSGSKRSKYGAVDDNEVDADSEEEEGVDDGDEFENEHDGGDPDDQAYEYDELEDYTYSLSPSSYKRKMRLYALVPLTAGLTLLFFTLLQMYIWPSTSTPSSSGVGTTFSLLLLGIAFWTVSFALRIPLFLLSSHLFYSKPIIIPLVSCALQVLCQEILRFSSIALAQVSVTGKVRVGDPSFSHIWTIALGWAMADVVVSIWQGYTQLGLYSDIVSPPTKYLPEYGYNRHPETGALELRAQARSELESLYGVPVPEIPISISCLLRVDTIMLSVALFLLISFSYLSHLPIPSSLSRLGGAIKTSNLTAVRSIKPPHFATASASASALPLNSLRQFTSTLPTFLGVTAFHMLLGFAWTPNVLPIIGLHVASYCSCIAALGALFVGLGWWDGI
ncbi:hypothetical protein Clacol_008277 [Clathrus columnatus]|uniref:Uncharacterized protein n=1 Tax=Clathrus columnatus TaxID=1419009 RepID=A0AAV5AQ48_9AGAM|nr:hypothetical protein Clacol_008277 [Clathrus columnatus]